MPKHFGKGIATKAVGMMVDVAFARCNINRITAWVYRPKTDC